MRPRRRFENCRTTIATVVMYLFILQSRGFAADGGGWRVLAGFIAPKFGETRPIYTELIFSAAGAGAPK
jgi:hypothetical protein